jgi:two-component system, cell cycle response regulator DivK
MSNLHKTLSPEPQEQAHPLVLVVEDHDDTREMLQLLLEIFGCRVVTAENGVKALSLADQVHPDLILMDLQIPLLDGFTVTRRIRASATLNHVPIVAVTGLATPKDRAAARDAGCSDYLEKPIDLGRLEELVKTLAPSAPGVHYPLPAARHYYARTDWISRSK